VATVYERLKKIIVKLLRVKEEEITPSTNLADATTPIPKGAVVQIPFLPFDLDSAFGEFLLVTRPKDLMCYLVPVLSTPLRDLFYQGSSRKRFWKRRLLRYLKKVRRE
jgi:hypothetical protein